MKSPTSNLEGATNSDEVRDALRAFQWTPLNDRDIPQAFLDLENRTRTNPFPWRGQFSPELVELLLSCYSQEGEVVLDPFAGVGTTVFEAARRGLSAVGVELNPAAYTMADTCRFIGIHPERRVEICRRTREHLDDALDDDLQLFSRPIPIRGSAVASLVELIRFQGRNEDARNLLANTLLRVVGADRETPELIFQGFDLHRAIIAELPFSEIDCRVVLGDARSLPAPDSSIDLVITSPPYINVFNYHQNCRRATELLGWNLLQVARSEFGANRKHRQNRFLTVVQFSLDIVQAFGELHRVVRPGGRVIVIIGRESNVRGVAFQNGRIVAAAGTIAGFRLYDRQERKFKNKFGKQIFEDILHFFPSDESKLHKEASLNLGRAVLEDALIGATGTVRDDLHSALNHAGSVSPSPRFQVDASRR